MKKQHLLWTLVLSILSVWMIMGCGGDDDKSSTGPSISIEDNIPGTWLTTSITMSDLAIHTLLGISMEATFEENLDLNVTLTQQVTQDSLTVFAFTGSYAIDGDTLDMNLNGPQGSIDLNGTITMNSTTSADYTVGMPYSLVKTLSPTYAPLLFADTTKTIPATFELSKQN